MPHLSSQRQENYAHKTQIIELTDEVQPDIGQLTCMMASYVNICCVWHLTQLALQLAETKLRVDSVERERDFYFDKLRDIEILCQMPELQSVPVRPCLLIGPFACTTQHLQHAAAVDS